MKGKRQQAGLLLREDFRDGAGVIAGPGALVSDLVAPSEGLTVEVLQGGEGPGREEAVTNILNGALHAPFGSSCRLHLMEAFRNEFESFIPFTLCTDNPSIW